MTPLDEFATRVQAHDFTYQYSDDHRHWVAGENSKRVIRELARSLPAGEAARIWNAEVDRRRLGSDWYWKESA